MNFWLALFMLLFITVYIKPGNNKSNRTSLLFPLVFFCFTFCLVIYSKDCFKSAQYGFNLWWTVVLPSLFPFFVSAELLKGTSLIKQFGKIFEPIMRPIFNVPGAGSFAFLMGLFSGYPVGAKIGAELYDQGLCTKNQAERLIAFSNNSSPLFITGAVAVGIFNKPELGLLLLAAHYLGCITVGIILGLHSRLKSNKNLKHCLQLSFNRFNEPVTVTFSNIGIKLSEAIINSINTLLMIGGYIVIFSVLVTILSKMSIILIISSIIKSVLFFIDFAFSLSLPISSGIFEITSGINLVKLCFAPLAQKIIIASLILGWGGLSVHAQVAGIVSKYGISVKPYLLGKFLQGIFSAIYTAILLKFSGQLDIQGLPVFAWNEYPSTYSISYNLLNSSVTCAIIFIFILSVPLFIRHKEKIKGNKTHPSSFPLLK
ncbi:MAG: sporulation integral membrane protein YlbJ [Ignavibacteriales bacterium]